MKKFLLLLSVVAFAFTGCYDYVGPEEPNVGNLSFSRDLFEVDSSAHDCYVTVFSDYDWTATSTESWIRVYPENGVAGESELYFYVEQNWSSDERAAQVIVSCEEYNLTAVIDVFQGGAVNANEFTFTVTNIGEQSADFTINATSANRTFYWNYHTKADVMSEGTVAFMEYYYDLLKEAVNAGYYTWAELLDTGSVEYTTTKLKPDTTYLLWAFGIDANGNLTSTDLSYYEFTTAPSSFDTSVWSGVWDVTTSMIYKEEIVNSETYQAGFVDVSAEPYTRSIEIVDGVSMDASLKGYALVYGWDGNFPDGITTGENCMPAFGLYNANTIELVNGEVVVEDPSDGSVLMWLPVCEYVDDAGSYIYVTGDFAPYKFVMGTDGAVTIEGAAGIGLSIGMTVDVKLFHLAWLVGGSIYPAIMSDGPVYHFAGSHMTAAKAGDNSVAPAKLSAKKNIKVMHKYANAKSAAMQFSSAVKMAKLAK